MQEKDATGCFAKVNYLLLLNPNSRANNNSIQDIGIMHQRQKEIAKYNKNYQKGSI